MIQCYNFLKFTVWKVAVSIISFIMFVTAPNLHMGSESGDFLDPQKQNDNEEIPCDGDYSC